MKLSPAVLRFARARLAAGDTQERVRQKLAAVLGIVVSREGLRDAAQRPLGRRGVAVSLRCRGGTPPGDCRL